MFKTLKAIPAEAYSKWMENLIASSILDWPQLKEFVLWQLPLFLEVFGRYSDFRTNNCHELVNETKTVDEYVIYSNYPSNES